ncbi:M16 family metallopeptidase [Haliangium ochraceum]|nr:M16 family metallopeptidase [Haliangium ochraceum]
MSPELACSSAATNARRGRSFAIPLAAGLLLSLAACGEKSPPPEQPTPPQPSVEVETADTPSDILASSDLPEPLPAPLADDAMGVTVHRLANGLTVYISTDRQTPRFTSWIAVRAGSRHDPADSTGLAHYLEHMLFKGTGALGTIDADAEAVHLLRIAELYDALRATDDEGERGEILTAIDAETQKSARFAVPNEFEQTYGKLGINRLNAFTSFDQTVYLSEVPSTRLEAWARVEAERFRNPRFRLFYPELEAVYEEKNRSLDNPAWRTFESMFQALFPGHPYGSQSTIGLIEHLKVPAYADMVAFFQRWYVPNNIAIVLAGDIDAETALPVIEKYFSDWAPRALETPAAGELAPLSERVQRTVKAPGEAEVHLAWQLVPANHEDEPALYILDQLMDNATAGLIEVELVLSQKLPDAGAYTEIMREAGAWMMYGTAREGQSLAEVEGLLLGVVEKLKAGDFTQEQLDAVKLNATIREMRELESNWARVAKMTEAFVNHTPWSQAADRSERIKAVTREDVIAVANTYLGDAYVAVYREKGEFTPPKITKPQITPVAIDPERQSAFAAEILAMPASELEPEWLVEGEHYTRTKLPSGTLIAAPNRANELFTLSYEFDFGYQQRPLLCLALELMEQSGIRGEGAMSPAELKRALFAMGTTVSVRCGVDSASLTLSGIDDKLEDSVRLLDAWLHRPALTQDTRDKLVANILSQRKDELEDPRQIGRALANFARYGKNSPSLVEPSNQALRRANLRELGRLLASLPSTRHRSSYFGPRAADAVAAQVTLGRRHRPAPKVPAESFRRVADGRIFFLDQKRAQAEISITLPEKPLPAEERALARLFSEYVGGGMGALIFQEIREARGLAYSAWGYYATGRRPQDAAAVFASIGTQADKTFEALKAMLPLLRQTPLQPARFASAKRNLLEEYRTNRVLPRAVPDAVKGWDDLGEASDPRPRSWEFVQTAEIDQLGEFSQRLGSEPLIISIMGDAERIDMDALGSIAPIEKVTVEQLFSY